MPANAQKVALYCQGTFSIPNPNAQQAGQMVSAAADIAASGFGTVLLGQWHVHENGDIYYNDSPLNSVLNTLQVIPTALKLGSPVQKVLLSFGPFTSDFEGIRKNLDQFKKTMAGVVAMTGIDGFDWDLEGSQLSDYAPYHDLLVDLTRWATGMGLMVTAAPYNCQQFWNGVLKETNANGAAGFSWWNLQLYGGAVYGQWVTGLHGLVSNPQSFLTAGYNIEGMAPGDVQSAISSLQAGYPLLDGGFLWRYEDIAPSGYTTAQFAQSVIQGLGGPSSVEVPAAEVAVNPEVLEPA